MRSVELCAGAGGQALGLEMAGFEHSVLVELEAHACATLKTNRPDWNVLEMDVKNFKAAIYSGVDLLAAGVPCPPFSVAGKQLGSEDDRDLFPEVIRVTKEVRPKAVLIENVRGLLSKKFDTYRKQIEDQFKVLGFHGEWHLLDAAMFGVPQTRQRVIFIAMAPKYWRHFKVPAGNGHVKTVAESLYPLMGKNGWRGLEEWRSKAGSVAPTIVGGSKKHGGPDLGPTRAREAWKKLGVDGKGIAEHAPSMEFTGMPKLTVEMAAAIQGFPNSWIFTGKKTVAYRQVGNAFPPPVARAIGKAIKDAIMAGDANE